MSRRPLTAIVSLAALLSACGGGSSGGVSGGGAVSVTPTPTPTAAASPTPTAAAGCSLRERQNWASAQLREFYLFPELLPASLDPAPYASVDSYIDALTATARAQRKDRFFTYLTSIAAENAFYESGSSAGFGFRLSTSAAQRRVYIAETFEGTPALAAGIDRGSEILAIGTTAGNLRTVGDIIAAEGSGGVTAALGPSTAGTTRVLRVTDPGSTTPRVVTIAKADYELTPVSSRYGARIIDDGGRKIGYVNLRTFISTADPALRSAFAQFRTAGVTELIVDFRYNGGGLVSIAELFGDLLGRNRTTSEVYSYTTFNAAKSASNRTKFFAPAAQSVAPTKIAFIGTGSTASASELVINAFLPYLDRNVALIGTNTFGKPVGQVALDRAACDDRLRVVAFATQNAARQGAYYDGLAATVPTTCQATDDVTRPLGDPQEASVKSALDFLAGRACTAIGTATASEGQRSFAVAEPRELLTPDRPTTAQREAPGAF